MLQPGVVRKASLTPELFYKAPLTPEIPRKGLKSHLKNQVKLNRVRSTPLINKYEIHREKKRGSLPEVTRNEEQTQLQNPRGYKPEPLIIHDKVKDDQLSTESHPSKPPEMISRSKTDSTIQSKSHNLKAQLSMLRRASHGTNMLLQDENKLKDIERNHMCKCSCHYVSPRNKAKLEIYLNKNRRCFLCDCQITESKRRERGIPNIKIEDLESIEEKVERKRTHSESIEDVDDLRFR